MSRISSGVAVAAQLARGVLPVLRVHQSALRVFRFARLTVLQMRLFRVISRNPRARDSCVSRHTIQELVKEMALEVFVEKRKLVQSLLQLFPFIYLDLQGDAALGQGHCCCSERPSMGMSL